MDARDRAAFPEECRGCGLLLFHGNIFDAAEQRSRWGPILGLHEDADPKTAKAGYVGVGSGWWYDFAPELYRCPKCGADPVSGRMEVKVKSSEGRG